MTDTIGHYIDGRWPDPEGAPTLELRNPADDQVSGYVQAGTPDDVDRAVTAARQAFATWSRTGLDDRLDLLRSIVAQIDRHGSDLADAVTTDMGIPIEFSHLVLEPAKHAFQVLIDGLPNYPFEERRGEFSVVKEPIGVGALIPPWNYPALQMSEKVAPAIAVGCTAVLKPAELSAHSGGVFARILHDAGVPRGVVNVVHGRGSVVGPALTRHPDVDVVAFTGSTEVGIQVQKDAADTVKRVTQELGGKSAHVVLPDADFASAVQTAVFGVMSNSGQTCAAPTRTIVPRARLGEFVEQVTAAVEALAVGDPRSGVFVGPVASEKQWHTVQRYIRAGIDEGATVITGGPGRPEGVPETGWYVRPTVFLDVTNDMTIAREEIFGPVMSIIAYDTVDEAVGIANDSPYGLAAYVEGRDAGLRRDVALQLRAGQVVVNTRSPHLDAPFGGYKRSGNGRIWGMASIEEFLETKALVGPV